MTETDRQTERLENILFLIVITFLAMAMRFFLFPIESGDYLQFLHPWYETLKETAVCLLLGWISETTCRRTFTSLRC